jgi:molybdopterin-guanine dinucleotide biosynthesis protein MobB
MKIIHVAGWSGSGKTTFTLDLVAALSMRGSVGTIKHIGEHVCDLPDGKDTTRHYLAGATISAGIDLEKTIITSRSVALPNCLALLSDAGVRYAVVEGFKSVPFRKVVFGDLDTPGLVRNPSVSDVIDLLHEFDDYYTLQGLIHEFENPNGGPLRAPGEKDEKEFFTQIEPGQGRIYTLSGYSDTQISLDDTHRIEDQLLQCDGIGFARFRVNPPVFESGSQYFALVRSKDTGAGIKALCRCEEDLSVSL